MKENGTMEWRCGEDLTERYLGVLGDQAHGRVACEKPFVPSPGIGIYWINLLAGNLSSL